MNIDASNGSHAVSDIYQIYLDAKFINKRNYIRNTVIFRAYGFFFALHII